MPSSMGRGGLELPNASGMTIIIAEDEARSPLGYCIFKDTYSGRDDVGIIYQINVMP